MRLWLRFSFFSRVRLQKEAGSVVSWLLAKLSTCDTKVAAKALLLGLGRFLHGYLQVGAGSQLLGNLGQPVSVGE